LGELGGKNKELGVRREKDKRQKYKDKRQKSLVHGVGCWVLGAGEKMFWVLVLRL
jgi:hypothetical protein